MSAARQFVIWLAALVAVALALYVLRAVLLPFVAGAAFAYFVDPVVDRLERLGLSRTLGTSAVVALLIIAMAYGLLLFVPLLQAEVVQFLDRLPDYLAAARGRLESLVITLQSVLSAKQSAQLQGAAGAIGQQVLGQLIDFFRGVVTSGMALINLLSLVFITPIVAFCLLRDWDRIIAWFNELLPRDHAETIRGLMVEIDRRLSGFVRGQILVAMILGTFYAIGLRLIGLEFGIVVGLSAGLLSFIPYVGSIGGFIVSVGLALAQFSDWPPVLAVAAIFLIGQAVEGNFLSPYLVGARVGLHPVWVIFALLAGGALLGLLGLLLALPAAATIAVFVRFAVARYRASALYLGAGGASSRSEDGQQSTPS